ncbi:MAG: DUF192 domain-containing protein [Candidatus Saccharimonadaceae bacterium]
MKVRKTTLVIAALFIIGVVTYFVLSKTDGYKEYTEKSTEPIFKKQGELIFLNKLETDTIATIDIEVADNDQKTAQGLMYRNSMSKNAGMLFFMRSEEIQGFWMKNTYISLDMIFVNRDKEIVTIHPNTTPLLESSYLSTSPALYVVEVNAGFCNAHHIIAGDKIDFTITKK